MLRCGRAWTPNALRSFYYRQPDIDAPTLSTLIALFGSLSAPSRVYASPLVSRMRGVTAASYWPFVVTVGARKVQNGMSLTDSDRFWLMRAALQPVVDNKASSEKLAILIARARHHYHAIRSRAFHPEVHVPYMKTLLETRDPRYIAFVAQDMAYVLRTHPFFHPWLLEVLHILILRHGVALPNATKEAVVSALWKCARDSRDSLDTLSHTSNAGSIDTPQPTQLLDVTDIAHRLSSFWSRRHLHSLSDPHDLWLAEELCTVLSPSQELSQRWMALTLVALLHSPAEPTDDPHVLNDGALNKLQSSTTTCWRVIFGLATLEKLFKFSDASLSLQHTVFRNTLRILYETWFHVTDTRTVPRDITCAITASFFRLAGIAGDASLVDGCLALCDLGMLWNPDPLRAYTRSNTFMSAQYIVALLRLHGPNTNMVLRTLDAISPDAAWQCTVLATTLRELVVKQPQLAFAVHGIAERNGRSVGALHSHSLAVSLAQCGVLDHAIEFLRGERVKFSQEQRGTLLTAIIRRIQDDAPLYPPVSILTSLADALLALYTSHSPPEAITHTFGQFLLILCRHSQGRKVVDLVVSIMRVSPGYFNLAVMRRLCRALLRHRQFRCAVRILDIIETLCPATASRLRTAVAMSATRAGATRTVKNLRGYLIPSVERYLYHRAQTNLDRARARSGHIARRSYLSFRLAAFLRTLSPDDPAFDHLFVELLHSGRLLASKRIFFQVLPSISSPTRRTTLANVFLSGISHAPRNGRRVRKVLALAEDLVATHGIKPDRVTLNIIVRTMLGWRRVFDRLRVRALFDQLVRGGYPAGDAYSAEVPPFMRGDGVSVPPPILTEIPMAVGRGIEEKLDFKRHVRPLYRMFIKAFYTRDDTEAARRVIGILKVEERKDESARVARVRGEKEKLRL